MVDSILSDANAAFQPAETGSRRAKKGSKDRGIKARRIQWRLSTLKTGGEILLLEKKKENSGDQSRSQDHLRPRFALLLANNLRYGVRLTETAAGL